MRKNILKRVIDMPYSDRKKGKPVSPNAKEIEYETCRSCGTLIPFGSKCPECGHTFESYQHRWDKWKKSEQK